ncbi:MAG: hypothetical protein M5U09_13695 [Gammaproteobacteria bacterium]|nr:hypothetical protein [Gammaproteobacteria bacterium]
MNVVRARRVFADERAALSWYLRRRGRLETVATSYPDPVGVVDGEAVFVAGRGPCEDVRDGLLVELADVGRCLPTDSFTRRCLELTASGVSIRSLVAMLRDADGLPPTRAWVSQRLLVGWAEFRGALRASGLIG